MDNELIPVEVINPVQTMINHLIEDHNYLPRYVALDPILQHGERFPECQVRYV